MADKLERIYVVPLRKEWLKVPNYKRARKGVVALKQFIAKHMGVTDRNVDNVKLDVYLNNDMWSRGSRNSPSKIKVKATKEGDIVHVTFVEIPEKIKFAQSKHVRLHKKSEKKETKKEDEKEEKTEDQKKAEAEKEQAAAIIKEQVAESQAKASKHTTKTKQTEIKRMALKK